MPSTYSNLKVQLMSTGENNTTWGDVTNTNLGTAIEEAIVGSATITFANASQTLTLTDTNATQTARNLRLNLTGTATSGYNLVVPSIQKPYLVNNGTDGAITVKNSTGTGIAVPAGKTMWVYNNGTNVVDAITYLSSLTLGTPLPIASGGTGSNTAAGVRSAFTGWEQIATVSPSGSATATLSSIPSTYSDILIVFDGISHNNSLSTAQIQYALSSDGSTFSTAVAFGGSAFSYTVNVYGGIFIPRYTGSSGTLQSSAASLGSAPATGLASSSAFSWRVNTISAVRLSWSSAAQFDAGTVTVYGR